MSADDSEEYSDAAFPAEGHGSESILAFADRLRASTEDQSEVQETYDSWVTVRVSARSLALPVTHVREILRLPELTRVPNAPRPVAGIMNLRGHVLPVVDTQALLGLPCVLPTDASRVLVFLFDNREVGLIVDEANGLERLQVELVQSVPDSEPLSRFAHGVFPSTNDSPPILLLEPHQLFAGDVPVD